MGIQAHVLAVAASPALYQPFHSCPAEVPLGQILAALHHESLNAVQSTHVSLN